jgi:hypothetical protein
VKVTRSKTRASASGLDPDFADLTLAVNDRDGDDRELASGKPLFEPLRLGRHALIRVGRTGIWHINGRGIAFPA